jgi:hypothetical protein
MTDLIFSHSTLVAMLIVTLACGAVVRWQTKPRPLRVRVRRRR